MLTMDALHKPVSQSDSVAGGGGLREGGWQWAAECSTTNEPNLMPSMCAIVATLVEQWCE